MKTILITYLKAKPLDKITCTRILVEYNSTLGLKGAKEKMDKMLDGVPIDYEVENDRLDDFLKELKSLKVEYEVR